MPEVNPNIDLNGDGVITDEELALHLEARRKELEDADAMRDAQRNMAWFALFGMLLYPFAVVGASWMGLSEAIVAAFYAKEAMGSKK